MKKCLNDNIKIIKKLSYPIKITSNTIQDCIEYILDYMSNINPSDWPMVVVMHTTKKWLIILIYNFERNYSFKSNNLIIT